MTHPQKITLEALRTEMQIFLDFPHVEENLQQTIEQTIAQIILSRAQNGGRDAEDVLTDYLDVGEHSKERLKFIIGLSGGSMEKMKRVYSAMFPATAWGAMKQDAQIRRAIARFLIHPDSTDTFIPSFIRKSFMLPENWIQLLRDETYLRAVAHNLAQSKYAVGMGIALEEAICKVVSDCGYEFRKGAVEIVDNKEVDIAIPNTTEPRILIMSSYQLTTASAQSSKANEQARMYQDVQSYNRRRRQRRQPQIWFVNVVDGGGWLARANDLESIWRECDYCFSYAGLQQLNELLYNLRN